MSAKEELELILRLYYMIVDYDILDEEQKIIVDKFKNRIIAEPKFNISNLEELQQMCKTQIPLLESINNNN